MRYYLNKPEEGWIKERHSDFDRMAKVYKETANFNKDIIFVNDFMIIRKNTNYWGGYVIHVREND